MGTLRGSRLSGLGLVFVLLVVACDPDETVPDAGAVRTDSGPGSADDGGADAGTDGGSGVDGGADAGTDGGTQEPAPCERTLGVCAGKTRAQVDGGYEEVCRSLSYGPDYEQVETRCDGLDNDCDGVADPTHWSRVTELASPPHGGGIASLRVDGGVLVAVANEWAGEARILRLDSRLMPQGESSVPLERGDGGPEYTSHLALVRTSQGPAMHYAVRGGQELPSRVYMAPLDETGGPAPLTDGGSGSVKVAEEAVPYLNSRVEASPDGTRLLFVWGSAASFEQGPRQLKGLVTDAEGQALAGPKELLREVSDSGVYIDDVLWLRNGQAAVAATQVVRYLEEDRVRVLRFDEALAPLGEERTFDQRRGPVPTLVDLGPNAGGPLESPVLVMRHPAEDFTHHKLQTVSHLFDGGTPQTRVETLAWERQEDREVPWFGAFASERGLRLAWLSKRFVTSDSRFWTWEEGGTRRDRSPGPERLPMHFHAQWVLLEELAPGQMGALIMTSSESKHYLDAVRYCAP